MNKNKTFIASLILFILSSILFADEFYQFQVRQSCENNYSIYLYNSITKEKHFIQSDSPVSIKNKNETIYGGGTTYSVVIKGNKLQVIFAFEDTTFNGTESLPDENVLYEYENELVKNIISSAPVILKIPEFSRNLERSKGKNNLYGDDIFFLQEIINFKYFILIDIDGYFGKQTEEAVKQIQKKLGLKQTGVVTKELWDILTKGN